MAQWFGPKEPGFELGIRTWQGWLATVVFIALLVGVRFIPFQILGFPLWAKNVVPGAVVVIFLSLVFWKWERD